MLPLLAPACSGGTSSAVAVPPTVTVPIAEPSATITTSKATPAPPEPPEPTGDGYEPVVRVGNTTSLNAVRVPFAAYINAVHARIHPLFAEAVTSFNQRPPKGFVGGDLVTRVEIVIEQKTGKIVRLGVFKSSGVTAFDAVVLETFRRAQPLPAAPEAIASPDGNVYLHWDLQRDPFDACSSRNASPFLLKKAP